MALTIAFTEDLDKFVPLDEIELETRKQTSVDKVGGILCHICDTIVGNKKEYDQHYRQHNTGSKEIIYTCVVCNKHIPTYPSFRGHCYLNHVVKNKFQCKYCPKKFSKLSILSTHISTIHDHKCSTCNQKFTSKKDLEIHKKIIHSVLLKSSHPCVVCNTSLDNVQVCTSHIDNHCEVLYPCPICKEVQPNKTTAIKHLSVHFSEILPMDIVEEASYGEDSSIDILGGIRCCYCNSLHANRNEINLHLSAEHPKKPIVYMCNVCNKIYEKYDLFGNHCYDHFSKGKFQCEHCPRTFSRLSLLVIHTEVFHIACSLDKPFGCAKCGHGFMTSFRLKEHMRIVHEEEAPQSRCMKPSCSATFDKPRDLVQHLKNHSPLLDNWCKQCGLQFSTLDSAAKHLDVHRITNYSCPICKKTYGEKYFLVKHIPTHFEAVLHICKTCGKSYHSRRRLLQHLKSHANSLSYQCTFCTKSFLKPHELTQHLNIHTGRKPYPCKFCSRTFTNYPNWSKHLSRVHGADKAHIRQMNVELRAEALAAPVPKSPSAKPESGIESAGSEVSDVNTFLDDSDDAGSVADNVTAAIDRIDALGDDSFSYVETKFNLPTENSELAIEKVLDDVDETFMKAIVEDIDAMCGGLDATPAVDPFLKTKPEQLHYADLLPVENNFDTVPAVTPSLPGLAEYGPDFSGGLTSLEDADLPHIDPLLTTKHQPPYSLTTTTPEYHQHWNPVIVKAYSYEDNNEMKNVFFACS